MKYINIVKPEHQVTLPKSDRDSLNIKIRQKVRKGMEKSYTKTAHTPDITTIAGFLKNKVKQPGNILDGRESLELDYNSF